MKNSKQIVKWIKVLSTLNILFSSSPTPYTDTQRKRIKDLTTTFRNVAVPTYFQCQRQFYSFPKSAHKIFVVFLLDFKSAK